MANWYNKITDTIGLTDSDRNERTLKELRKGQGATNTQLDTDLAEQLGMLTKAGEGRSLSENLERFSTGMGNSLSDVSRAGDIASQQVGAGNPEQVAANLNPKMGAMLDATAQRVQGGAGSALQSSATNRNMAQAVSQQAGDLWEQAFKDTMQQSQNNLQAAGQMGTTGMQGAQLAGQQLAAENAPMEDWINLKNDLAMQRYAGNMGLTQAAATAAGADQSVLGQIFGQNPGGAIGSIASAF